MDIGRWLLIILIIAVLLIALAVASRR